MSDITIIKVIDHGPQGVPGEATPEFLGLVAQVTTDKGLVAADKAAVSVDRAAVAVDKLAVANDRTLATAGALVASQALGLLADSTTSLAIATGDKTFTVPTGKSFAAGMPVRASSKANPDTQAMIGVVKSYSGSTLVINVSSIVGSATRADWTIAVTGGALAPVGQTQDAQAIAELGRLERSLAAAGVPDESSLILDFIRGVHFASKAAITASILTLIAALPGSSFSRASTGTYWGSDGLLKTAAINEPRIEYEPAGNRMPLGLLMEPARTNLLTYSEQLDNAAWTKTRAAVSANVAIAPDGLLTADKLVEDTTASNTHSIGTDVTTAASTEYWLSIFLKAGERTRCAVQSLNFAGQDARTEVAIDLVSGAYTTTGVSPGAYVQNCGNGWWRVSIRSVRNATATWSRLSVSLADASGSTTYTGDGTSGLYVWGAQIEAGAEASSYIPTVASAVARAADSQIPLPYSANQTEGTLLVEFDTVGTGNNDPASINDGTTNNRALVRRFGNNVLAVTASGGVVGINSVVAGWPVSGPARVAFGIKAGEYAASVNGAAVVAYATVPFPVGLNRLSIAPNISAPMHVRRIIYVPRRLSNAKLPILSGNAWS